MFAIELRGRIVAHSLNSQPGLVVAVDQINRTPKATKTSFCSQEVDVTVKAFVTESRWGLLQIVMVRAFEFDEQKVPLSFAPTS